MKTLLFSLALLVAAPVLRAQDIATNFSPVTEPLELAGPSKRPLVPVLGATAATTVTSSAFDLSPEPASGQAIARLNGVVVQVQTLPGSGTVLISFSMPSQQNLGLLELVNARTGQVVYTGSVVVSEGQVELPVADPTQLFEVRLATDHDLVIARMAQ